MDWIGWMSEPEAWIALVTLTALEVVLGIDNIIFISILVDRLPEGQRDRARMIGLALAMIMRIALLLSLAAVMRLTTPLFPFLGHEVTGKDIILLLGGLFLIAKSTHEIHDKLEDNPEARKRAAARSSFSGVLVQIAVLDMVFSLDSVITAIGMARHIPVMVVAVVIAVIFMMVFSGMVSRFVNRHPTFKVLALSFLILIGVALMAEGLGLHIPRGYVYFAMAFSFVVELLNIRIRGKSVPEQPVLRG
ncbi:MAG TPA: TerC family protein [Verrucomicrobiales bacterium]|nr:TerC family protein [Verrucomicrobiales bacterium]